MVHTVWIFFESPDKNVYEMHGINVSHSDGEYEVFKSQCMVMLSVRQNLWTKSVGQNLSNFWWCLSVF